MERCHISGLCFRCAFCVAIYVQVTTVHLYVCLYLCLYMYVRACMPAPFTGGELGARSANASSISYLTMCNQ